MEQQNKSALPVLAALGKSLCALFLFLGCQSLVTLCYTIPVCVYYIFENGGEFLVSDILNGVLAYSGQITLISDLLAIIILALFFLVRKKSPLERVNAVACPPRMVLLGASMAPILYLAVTIVLSLLPQQWLEAYTEASSPLGSTGLLSVISVAVVAPIAEEVIFRGYILSRIRSALPGWLAVVISALLFGLCHGQAVWIGYAFLLGLLFGLLTLRSGSILPGMLAHIVFNAIGQLESVLSETGSNYWLPLIILVVLGVVGCCLNLKSLRMLFSVEKSADRS